jgi:hypothetical protein
MYLTSGDLCPLYGLVAVFKDDMFVEHYRSDLNSHHRQTTIGWQLHVQWKDRCISWTPLTDFKESNHVEATEYAVADKNVEEK